MRGALAQISAEVGCRPGQLLGLHVTQERDFIFALDMCETPAEVQGSGWEEPGLRSIFVELA